MYGPLALLVHDNATMAPIAIVLGEPNLQLLLNAVLGNGPIGLCP